MPRRKQRTEDWRQVLRDAGLRGTAARIELLELLARSPRPLTHQEAVDGLPQIETDRSTLFRALQDLTTAGLVRRLDLGDRVWRYERVASSGDAAGESTPHPHLLCVDCGNITCLTDDEVQVKLPKRLGTIEDVLLKGHCADCKES